MTVRVFSSYDTGAPTLTGLNGSLISVLDACLVNGYGTRTAAGWTKAFSGTNKAAYRQGLGSQFYLQVLDDYATQYMTKVRGYEAMTDVDTGTDPFPTVAQETDGLFFQKSTTADATVRNWFIIADEKTFYIHINRNGTQTSGNHFTYGFGEYETIKSGFTYNVFLLGVDGDTGSHSSTTYGFYAQNQNQTYNNGLYFARSALDNGVTKSVKGKVANAYVSSMTGTIIPQGMLFFNILRKPFINPIELYEYNGVVTDAIILVGKLKGIYIFGLNRTDSLTTEFFHNNIYLTKIKNLTGKFSGKEFIIVNFVSTSSYILLEKSNTW